MNALAFITITTPGKLRALELQIMTKLLYLVKDYHNQELQLMALKVHKIQNLNDLDMFIFISFQ